MWNDSEIDLEELETRLYGQVHHPAGEEEVLNLSIPDENAASKMYKRYFDPKRIPQASPFDLQHMYHTHSNNERAYFQRGQNNYDPPQQLPLHYCDPKNFYFALPAVNNIVVLPPAPQIFTKPADLDILRSEKQKARKQRRQVARRAKKKRLRMEERLKVFKEHHLIHKVNLVAEDKVRGNVNVTTPEIISLSESDDDSDCEIAETLRPVVVVSSDDESDKNEIFTSTGIKNEINSKSSEVLKLPLEKDRNDLNLTQDKNDSSNDDDVVLIEPDSNAVITINCDDVQILSDLNNSITESVGSVSITPTENPVERRKVCIEYDLDTPESTNDFLEHSFNSSEAIDGNSTSLTSQKSTPDVCETDSNWSVSDFDSPSKSAAVFTEQEFEVPSKEKFSQLNLDSFTDYIASKASASIPSILTPSRGPSIRDLSQASKRKSVRNSSDSSSESDYGEDKAAVIAASHSKAKQKRNSPPRKTLTSSSDSEDCVISEKNKNSMLPNLSPITSDEEWEDTKQLKLKQPKRKRKAQDEQVIKIIRKGEKKKQDESRFFSSSDSEVSEVELGLIGSESPQLSTNDFDIDLVNIENTSTPVKKQTSTVWSRKMFSDFWTDDMNKFYRESWGHENFNMEEIQKAMSDDPQMWKIIDRDYIHMKLTPKGPRCHRCRTFGHKAFNCTQSLNIPKCILCGASGHLETRCPNKLCTSCGRRSQYSTTYCGSCANSRHSVCKICRRRGHASSNCNDLWRRYHLTTNDGPLNQPNDVRLISPKDRWCSGCASQGHLEYECDYYNRTHSPADPAVHSYEDSYARRRPRDEMNQYLSQSQEENPRYSNRNELQPPQVSPWIIRYPQNSCNQNFIHLNSSFPVFQSIPNVFGIQQQQNLNNVFYPNYNIPSASGDDFNSRRNLDLVSEGDLTNVTNETSSRTYLRLNDVDVRKLTVKEGVDFIKKCRDEFNVQIKIINGKKKSKSCMFEGSLELTNNAKDAIVKYCSSNEISPLIGEPLDLLGSFTGKPFNMQLLQKSLAKLNNPNTHWLKVSYRLYQKITKNSRRLQTEDIPESDSKIEIARKKTLKKQYVALNAVVLGKLHVADGRQHMKVLTKAVQGKKTNEKSLKESYNYIFRNGNELDIDYVPTIRSLPCHINLKTEIEELFKSAASICKNNNMKEELNRLKQLYATVIHCQYTRNKVDLFKNLHSTIMQDGMQK